MLGLDFETASCVDLRKHGLDRYVNAPDFRALCAATYDGQMVHVWDFVRATPARREELRANFIGYITPHTLVAHNAGFELAVLEKSFDLAPETVDVRDSAVTARTQGASGTLASAAPQLLDEDKMEEGRDLIKLFSVPREDGTYLVDEWETWDDAITKKWETFLEYCGVDAKLSFEIEESCPVRNTEHLNNEFTMKMNRTGWPVDMKLVHAMQDQYLTNLVQIEDYFRTQYPAAAELNFNSTPQMQKFCRERGVVVTSLDEQHVDRYLKQVSRKLASLPMSDPKRERLKEVKAMLETKQQLGGSSLKKLQTIIDMVGDDGRLRHQYLHVGAGQTWRTSGRGVQMQNLKRLHGGGNDVNAIRAGHEHWNNETLSQNLRQCFASQEAGGHIIVGDFAAVESRALAYLAGADWKVDAFRSGKDMYKVLAQQMFEISYDQVTKVQRSSGKVGELSCGYGAGGGAVERFASKMGIDMTLEEANELVANWRDANPEIVEMWRKLDEAMHHAIEDTRIGARYIVSLGHGIIVAFTTEQDPESLRTQRSGTKTLIVRMSHAHSSFSMERLFRGVHLQGRDICYMKPSELKGGKLWLERWSKNGQSGPYKIYGGKLTGILTQSFCRELFFNAINDAYRSFRLVENVRIIGQFHDEIVLEWWPPGPASTPSDAGRFVNLRHAEEILADVMTGTGYFADFPLVAEVNAAPRYIK